jgi:hypothetical protein
VPPVPLHLLVWKLFSPKLGMTDEVWPSPSNRIIYVEIADSRLADRPRLQLGTESLSSLVVAHNLAGSANLLCAPIIRGQSDGSLGSFLGMGLILQDPNSVCERSACATS